MELTKVEKPAEFTYSITGLTEEDLRNLYTVLSLQTREGRFVLGGVWDAIHSLHLSDGTYRVMQTRTYGRGAEPVTSWYVL